MNITTRVLTIMNLCMTEDKVERRREVNPAVVAAETKIMEEKSEKKVGGSARKTKLKKREKMFS